MIKKIKELFFNHPGASAVVGLCLVMMMSAFTVKAVTVLFVPQGGTGASTFTAGHILQGNGTSAIQGSAVSGDATLAVGGALTISANAIEESMLKCVDAPADEECFTYEATTGDFEWQACGGGGGQLTEEEVQDYAWNVAGGTQTLITMTYQDATNDVDFVVDNNLHNYSWANVVDADITNTLTCSNLVAGSAVVDISTETNLVGGTGITLTNDTLSCDLGTAIDISAETNLTAGRSLTMSADSVVADAELYTDTKCIYFEDPTAADDFKSIWYARGASTITAMWCESDQTVNMDLQVDDGTPADVNGADLVCDSTPANDTSMGGDSTLSAGNRLDLAITSVSGTPTWVSICWTFTYDD